MCMEEALHWKQCCKYSALGILLSTCFLIQEYFITPHMLRLRRWVFHFYPLLFISWSRINAVNARLWDGTRRLFELLKPCVGLLVVPRHERAGMCEIKERAHAETWWCINGILFDLARCLSTLWLWWESVRRAMIADNVRVFIAFKGHPHVEDFKWVLYLVNQLVECVTWNGIFVSLFPYVNCCECCMVCVFFLLMICKCGNVTWRWWGFVMRTLSLWCALQ